MLFGRRISENRSTAILVALVFSSLICLYKDTPAGFLGDGLRQVVSVAVHPFWLALNGIQRGADYAIGLVINYDASRREARSLREELTDLRLSSVDHAELKAENTRLRRMLVFERAEPRLTPVVAKVISTRLDGTLLIDCGSYSGIREGMGVITKDGVIGVVARVAPFNSSVFTLNNPQCRIGAIVERNRVASWVQGSGSQLKEMCNMVYIDMKDDVRSGDKVVTNSGSIFPRGIPIGTIEDVDEKSLLKAASVVPAADPYRAEEVFVVTHSLPTASDLAGISAEESTQEARGPRAPVSPIPTDAPTTKASAAPVMPDTRTEQEKYAP